MTTAGRDTAAEGVDGAHVRGGREAEGWRPSFPHFWAGIPPFLIRSTIQVRFDDIFVIWCDTDLIRNGAGIDLIGIGVHDIDVILM